MFQSSSKSFIFSIDLYIKIINYKIMNITYFKKWTYKKYYFTNLII